MFLGMRPISRLLLSAAALFVVGMAPLPSKGEMNANAGQTTASVAPEVRLRKLHLVRPDLIPYPIEYEVYC